MDRRILQRTTGSFPKSVRRGRVMHRCDLIRIMHLFFGRERYNWTVSELAADTD